MFVIFLVMQPKAWQTFKNLLSGHWQWNIHDTNSMTASHMKISVTEASVVLTLSEDELVDIINDKQFYFINPMNTNNPAQHTTSVDMYSSRKISIGYLGHSYHHDELDDRGSQNSARDSEQFNSNSNNSQLRILQSVHSHNSNGNHQGEDRINPILELQSKNSKY